MKILTTILVYKCFFYKNNVQRLWIGFAAFAESFFVSILLKLITTHFVPN
jgi:hypothetical protein